MSIGIKKYAGFVLSAALVLVSAGAGWADDAMQHAMPKPGVEHAWLQQFVGNWEAETEAMMAPNQPPVKSHASESTRPLGAFWTITEVKSTMMDMPFTGNLTLGYDATKGKYVGTWVDSMTGKLWQYEGTLNAAGNTLTLETEGACPMRPGKLTRFREVIELKSPNHKVFSSSMLGDNGEWITMMTSHAHRKQ